MLVLISDLLSGLLITSISILLNGNMGVKNSCPLPLVGLFHHKQLIRTPYMLVYAYVVFTSMVVLDNTITGLMLYLFLMGFQIILMFVIFYKRYYKRSEDWFRYIGRITDISRRLFVSAPKKNNAETEETKTDNDSKLSLSDIQYLLHQLIFPSVFVTTNAYLVTNLFIFFKII